MEVLNQILADVDFFLSCRHGKVSAGGSCQNSSRTSRRGAGLCRGCHQQILITHEHSGTCENLVTLGSELRCADRYNPSTCATSERVRRIEPDVPVGRSKRWVGVAHTLHWFAGSTQSFSAHPPASCGPTAAFALFFFLWATVADELTAFPGLIIFLGTPWSCGVRPNTPPTPAGAGGPSRLPHGRAASCVAWREYATRSGLARWPLSRDVFMLWSRQGSSCKP